MAAAFLLQAVPALIGAFAGAPVLAREMETGTFRYAWTQGFGRWRWTLAKLVLLAIAVTAAAGVFSMLFSWYFQPFFADGSLSQSTMNQVIKSTIQQIAPVVRCQCCSSPPPSGWSAAARPEPARAWRRRLIRRK